MQVIQNWLARRHATEKVRRQVAQHEERIERLVQRIGDMHGLHMAAEAQHVEVREHLEHVVARLGKRTSEAEELLSQILIAVGRVPLVEGQPVSTFEGLPKVVTELADDYEDARARIDAVVEYLRKVGEKMLSAGPTEKPVRVEDVQETVIELLGAGAEVQDDKMIKGGAIE